ncbi:MAG TPA: acetylglutamate kinase [Vicinamibacterales bacterium]
MRPLVLKFGGELLEDRSQLSTVVGAVRTIAEGSPIVIVHGGGREIDAALKTTGIEKRQVDGLRITDPATLDVVVAVLAGTINTRFVAALNAAGVRAVGLTGADDHVGLSSAAPPHRAVDGRLVDLDRVGLPAQESSTRLLETLLERRFVPVLACIGAGVNGDLFNVNADTLAGHIAARVGARRLVIAGTTAGVLDANGRTLPVLDASAVAELVDAGTATAGMIAKLRACEHALAAHVDDVVIVDGRDGATLVLAATPGHNAPASATRLVRMVTA